MLALRLCVRLFSATDCPKAVGIERAEPRSACDTCSADRLKIIYGTELTKKIEWCAILCDGAVVLLSHFRVSHQSFHVDRNRNRSERRTTNTNRDTPSPVNLFLTFSNRSNISTSKCGPCDARCQVQGRKPLRQNKSGDYDGTKFVWIGLGTEMARRFSEANWFAFAR